MIFQAFPAVLHALGSCKACVEEMGEGLGINEACVISDLYFINPLPKAKKVIVTCICRVQGYVMFVNLRALDYSVRPQREHY